MQDNTNVINNGKIISIDKIITEKYGIVNLQVVSDDILDKMIDESMILTINKLPLLFENDSKGYTKGNN